MSTNTALAKLLAADDAIRGEPAMTQFVCQLCGGHFSGDALASHRHGSVIPAFEAFDLAAAEPQRGSVIPAQGCDAPPSRVATLGSVPAAPPNPEGVASSNHCRHGKEWAQICDACDDEKAAWAEKELDRLELNTARAFALKPALPSLQALQDRIHAFQLTRFPCQTLAGKIKHLKREADEVLADPADVTEHADCLILVLGIARLGGHTIDDLLAAARAKMTVNESRAWHPPDHDGVYHHKE